MKTRTLVAAVVVAATAVALGGAAAWAHAQGGLRPHGGFGHFGGGLLGFRHTLRELGLSDEQKTEVKSILRSHRQEFRDLAGRLLEIHEDVRQLGRQESLDEAAIRQGVSKAIGPLGDMAVLHAKVHREIDAVLTPEQRQKAEALHERLRSHLKELRKSMHELGDDLLEDHS